MAVMACRFNAKREKRKRNGENARKYRMKVSRGLADAFFGGPSSVCDGGVMKSSITACAVWGSSTKLIPIIDDTQPSFPTPTHQSSGPKFLAIKTRKRASKAEYSKRLEQYEMDFTAQIYKLQDVDALLAAASPTDDA